MITDAYVKLVCDNCGDEEEIQLTATARGGYDCRNVESHVKHLGWQAITEDTHACPDCAQSSDD